MKELKNSFVRSGSTVAIAMSGGVDSSVAAALLVEQGYDVRGIMLRLWSEPDSGIENTASTALAIEEAGRMAEQLGISFEVLDASNIFRESIVQYFLDSYLIGITPNPCMRCNQSIKWGLLMENVLAQGIDYLATGHYVILRKDQDGIAHLHQARDEHKDQSYVVSILTQKQLQHTLFPLGRYTKAEVRELARKYDLSAAEKADSQDLCFVNDNDYRRFLTSYAPQVSRPGPILNLQGEKLGEHQGLAFYTIGQRKGIGIAAPKPYYVLRKDMQNNSLIIGGKEQLQRSELYLNEVNWISGQTPDQPQPAKIKIRYRSGFVEGVVHPANEQTAKIEFSEAVSGITPGQFAVFYQEDEVLGSGVIQ